MQFQLERQECLSLSLSMWGARAEQWLKYHTLRALKKSNLFYSCVSCEGVLEFIN